MRVSILLFFLTPILLIGQTGYPEIDMLIQSGQYNEAQQLIKTKLEEQSAAKNLKLQSLILDRIKLDFNRDETYIRKTLSPYFPKLSDKQLEAWEASGALEMKIIEGKKKYFRNAVWNLFRVDSKAKARKIEIDGTREDEIELFLNAHIPQVIQQCKDSGNNKVLPQQLQITYTLTVKPDVVPQDSIIRAWLPYPRPSRARLSTIQLDTCSEQQYTLSPLSTPHSSIYMEKKAIQKQATVFSYQATYLAYNEWNPLYYLSPEAYDTSTVFYKKFTSERPPHLIFHPSIKALADSLTFGIEHPIEKAYHLYLWIGENIPWASALEYSTIPDIPTYCLNNMKGDCGIKAMLFINLCRYVGIPAKWQSGWFLYPEHINLHDWAEIYIEGKGWVPIDPDFNIQPFQEEAPSRFFFGGADAYRLIINDDFSGQFSPLKIHPRSETVDFQRGEVEWSGGNLYFDQWDYKMSVKYLNN